MVAAWSESFDLLSTNAFATPIKSVPLTQSYLDTMTGVTTRSKKQNQKQKKDDEFDFFTEAKKNSCGKIVYEIKPVDQLKRFLVLGTEGGTFYVAERKLEEINLKSVEKLLKTDKQIVLDTLDEYASKVFKKDHIIKVLARCCVFTDDIQFRKKSYELLKKICTIPTNLFMFLETYEELSKKYNDSTGWGKIHKKYISQWYTDKSLKDLAYHVTKYRQRGGWSNRDVLRLTHIKPKDDAVNDVFKYVVSGELHKREYETEEESDAMYFLAAADFASKSEDAGKVVKLIEKYGLVREHVNSCLLKDVDVLDALAQKMPLVATLRMLNRLTPVFEQRKDTKRKIVDRIRDEEYIKKTGVHPMQFLIALKTYSAGHGEKGSLMWNPDRVVMNAVDEAFYSSFQYVPKTNKKYLLALDVSGSMSFSGCFGATSITPREASCALSMVLANNEDCDIMGFSHNFVRLDIDPKKKLDDNLKIVDDLSFGATDISLPFAWASRNKNYYDVFVVFTDSETNSNKIPPVDALRMYRRQMNPNAKLIVLAMTSNDISIADPNDPGMLDIAGFSADTPGVIADFVCQKDFA